MESTASTGATSSPNLPRPEHAPSPSRLRVLGSELGVAGFATGWPFVRALLALLPPGMFLRLRMRILRAWGLRIGWATTIAGTPVLAGDADPRRNLTIGERCYLNWPLHLDTNAPITIGNRVTIGHHVVIITTDHRIGGHGARAGEHVLKPVRIDDGVWIGAGATLLPGVTIGAGAVVAAGALVTKDVAPDTLVGGVPAKTLRELE